MEELKELLRNADFIFNENCNEITIGETYNRDPLITVEKDYIDTAECTCFTIYHSNLNGRIQLFDTVEAFEDIKRLKYLK